MDLEIKFIKGEKFFKNLATEKLKSWPKKSRKNHNIKEYM